MENGTESAHVFGIPRERFEKHRRFLGIKGEALDDYSEKIYDDWAPSYDTVCLIAISFTHDRLNKLGGPSKFLCFPFAAPAVIFICLGSVSYQYTVQTWEFVFFSC